MSDSGLPGGKTGIASRPRVRLLVVLPLLAGLICLGMLRLLPTAAATTASVRAIDRQAIADCRSSINPSQDGGVGISAKPMIVAGFARLNPIGNSRGAQFLVALEYGRAGTGYDCQLGYGGGWEGGIYTLHPGMTLIADTYPVANSKGYLYLGVVVRSIPEVSSITAISNAHASVTVKPVDGLAAFFIRVIEAKQGPWGEMVGFSAGGQVVGDGPLS